MKMLRIIVLLPAFLSAMDTHQEFPGHAGTCFQQTLSEAICYGNAADPDKVDLGYIIIAELIIDTTEKLKDSLNYGKALQNFNECAKAILCLEETPLMVQSLRNLRILIDTCKKTSLLTDDTPQEDRQNSEEDLAHSPQHSLDEKTL